MGQLGMFDQVAVFPMDGDENSGVWSGWSISFNSSWLAWPETWISETFS